MKTPSLGIPNELKEEDPILKGFLEVLDATYESAYKEISKVLDLNDLSTVPDEYLDFLLFENGMAIFDGYTVTQKRALLQNVLDLDSKRYTRDGMALFLDLILTNLYVDVEVPQPLNKISFRNPAIGFPNSEQRPTAGRVYGDINPYIMGRTLAREIKIFLFDSDGTNYPDADTTRFLNQAIKTELPDLNPFLNYSFKNYLLANETVELKKLDTLYLEYKETVEGDGGEIIDEDETRAEFYEAESGDYYTVVGTATTFTQDFSVNDFIGLYSPLADRVYSYRIVEVESDLRLKISNVLNTDPIPRNDPSVQYYKPE